MSQWHTCTEDYIREADPRIKQKTIDHNKRDRNSHILKHSHEKGNSQVWDKDFKVLSKNYRSHFKRKIIEALLIK